ncbi:putative nucleotide-diphospho-sugar transferase [Acinetobacter indicus]|uniref:putative nucleotide-diphospho-sugar transferase n=1 Tax=Acinetobacter indicus TaxID=756892 RepID=UPI00144404A3|nr:putative nucleotide-diphospho-sugar transferase [Acinetobacter indicus]
MDQAISHHLKPIDLNGISFWDFISDKNLEINFLSENCLTVKKGNLYLTVFPDGKANFHATVCREWEKIYILDSAVLNFVNQIIKEKIQDRNGKLLKKYELLLHEDKIHIRLGSHIITPSYLPAGVFEEDEGSLKYKTIFKTVSFKKGNLLIYFCVYGGDEYFECFKYALRSLIVFGRYSGDILIKTDNIDKAILYTKDFNNKFEFSLINFRYGIFNRYYLYEDVFSKYSSIIYFDSDILTINPIEDLLYSLLAGGDIVAYNEFSFEERNIILKNRSPWFGLDYMLKFNIVNYQNIVNSGFFVINNLNKVKPIFERVINYRFLERRYGDQPFLNIALHNSNLNIELIENNEAMVFARSFYDFMNNLDKTLVHYNSGVGNLTKLSLMEKTYSFLRDYKGD